MNNEQILTVLKIVRHLLEDPKRWTQGAMARESNGNPTYTGNPQACQWCIAGAIRRAMLYEVGFSRTPASCSIVELKLLEQIDLKGPFPLIEDFNDLHSHAEVLALIDKTIATL